MCNINNYYITLVFQSLNIFKICAKPSVIEDIYSAGYEETAFATKANHGRSHIPNSQTMPGRASQRGCGRVLE